MSELIFENVHHIMFRISLASHDFSLNPRFPLVIAELVQKCANPKIYHEARNTIDEVMFWLDNSDQKRSLLLLRALREYTRSLNIWFPDLMPTCSSARSARSTTCSEENDVVLGGVTGTYGDRREIEKVNDENYPLIRNAVAILNRFGVGQVVHT